MYTLYSLKDMLTISPDNFDKDLEEVATTVLKAKYEGVIDRNMGVIVCVFNVHNISDGIIYAGDPSTHHDAEFDVLTYMPKAEEIVAGEVTELAEFGAFIRIGPVEGLAHISQIANEFFSFDKKAPMFVSKQSGKTLRKGDAVYAKISTVSMKSTVKDSKIALTMRPEGLGKPEWYAAGAAGKGVQQRRRQHKGGSGSARRR